MINIKELYDTVNNLADKNNGRFIEEEEFNTYTNLSSLELFDECIGATNKRLDNRTLVAYGKSQNTDKRLDPFRASQTIPVVEGDATLPTECEKITAVLTSRKTPKALIRIDEDRIGMIYDNPLREPNEDEVYYMETGDSTLQVFGLANSIYVTFLKKPTKGVYATKTETITVGSRTVTRQVYDSTASVNLDWNEREMLDIVTRILAKAGIPMKDTFIEQMVAVNKTNE